MGGKVKKLKGIPEIIIMIIIIILYLIFKNYTIIKKKERNKQKMLQK